MSYVFTSESVTIGHPDKLCDYVADSILDELLRSDPMSRVACEVTAVAGKMNVFGEITTSASVDYEGVARRAIREVGYIKDEYMFTDKCEIDVSLHEQSNDISSAVSLKTGELGAGDQGLMFGYACNETPSLMPFAVDAAHRLTRRLRTLRESGEIPYLRPDGKSQVSVKYNDSGAVEGIRTIVVSAQTDDGIDIGTIRDDLREKLVFPLFASNMLKDVEILANPSGRFVLGGPAGDSGLTGRKIIVDTYGGAARHGGGAFSGKDPTKVDRSAAYMLRRIAKNIVFHGLASRCELQAAYSIGVSRPVSMMVRTFGTGKFSDSRILEKVGSFYDLRPQSIIDFLRLREPVYAGTNDGGAFGNDSLVASWEEIDPDF